MAFAERSAGRNERLEVTIADLAASQWGLVTTMQVLEAGGTSAWISRKVGAQMMARVLPRVCAFGGSPIVGSSAFRPEHSGPVQPAPYPIARPRRYGACVRSKTFRSRSASPAA